MRWARCAGVTALGRISHPAHRPLAGQCWVPGICCTSIVGGKSHPPRRCSTANQPTDPAPVRRPLLQVSCKDRHGLLSDIVKALKSAPVEIVTAAVTTTKVLLGVLWVLQQEV